LEFISLSSRQLSQIGCLQIIVQGPLAQIPSARHLHLIAVEGCDASDVFVPTEDCRCVGKGESSSISKLSSTRLEDGVVNSPADDRAPGAARSEMGFEACFETGFLPVGAGFKILEIFEAGSTDFAVLFLHGGHWQGPIGRRPF
jgi:hypothetical protein